MDAYLNLCGGVLTYADELSEVLPTVLYEGYYQHSYLRTLRVRGTRGYSKGDVGAVGGRATWLST